jgi:hypothetical protein
MICFSKYNLIIIHMPEHFLFSFVVLGNKTFQLLGREDFFHRESCLKILTPYLLLDDERKKCKVNFPVVTQWVGLAKADGSAICPHGTQFESGELILCYCRMLLLQAGRQWAIIN